VSVGTKHNLIAPLLMSTSGSLLACANSHFPRDVVKFMIFAPPPENQQNKVKVVVRKSGANDSSVREDETR
jgi:hypothetical protein